MVSADLKMEMGWTGATRENWIFVLIMSNLRLLDSIRRPVSIYEPLFVY